VTPVILNLSNLIYLREIKTALTSRRQNDLDDVLIGILSIRIPEQEWQAAVQLAVKLARKEKP
jgi:hypothetical protein